MTTYPREPKGDIPVLAICYDFDKTLSPDNMQAGYIQAAYEGDQASFWSESNAMAETNEMDTNLAYMYKMIRTARGKVVLSKHSLECYGAQVQLFPGVEGWFERMKQYGENKGVLVEHYIISSGLKEMIQGTTVAKSGAFKRIYASSYMFDEQGVPIWPAQAVNYTNKTQFLFRIEKGTLDVNDSSVNENFLPEELRVPFRNIVYIGDSETDIPCMKLVNSYGGHSIGVYNNVTLDKSKVYKMLNDNRIKYFAPADYSEGSDLDRLVKSIIDRTASNEILENVHYSCVEELNINDLGKKIDNSKRIKENLLSTLDSSSNFAHTHYTIKKLHEIDDWKEDECERLIEIALRNTQVRYILNDSDVKKFYKTIIKIFGKTTEKTKEIESYFK